MRAEPTQPLLLRRSRGYVPEPLDGHGLPERSVLALGAFKKVTVSTLQHGELVVGRHLGDLDNSRTAAAFAQELDRMIEFGHVEPEAVAVDLHPDLMSAELAGRRFPDLPLIAVQHHHAHLAAVLLEHELPPAARAAGIILDGAGYAEDGTVWGGEVLVGGYADSERVGHLRRIPLPGGDRAALEPRRMATSLLVDAGLERPDLPGYDPRIAEICAVSSVAPLTSSAGRLFDGAAALLGVALDTQDYEGEAAARLEATADPAERDAYPLPATDGALDTRVLITALVDDRAELPTRAARFHNGLADGLAALALEAGVGLVVLGGGCMINRLLLRRLATRLRDGGARVLIPRLLPPGDGGISAGQAACAACRLAAGD